MHALWILILKNPPSPLTRIPGPIPLRPSAKRARASTTGAPSPVRGHLLLPRLLAMLLHACLQHAACWACGSAAHSRTTIVCRTIVRASATVTPEG